MDLAFSWLGPFLLDSMCLVLMGYLNATLDPKIDRGQGARGRRGDHRLVDLIDEFGLVDR